MTTPSNAVKTTKKRPLLLTLVIGLCLVCIVCGAISSAMKSLGLLPADTPTPSLAPTLTASPIPTATITPTPPPTNTPPPPATQTAIAIQQAHTQVALKATTTAQAIRENKTATAQALNENKTATAQVKAETATALAAYLPIDWRELKDYADQHIGELVKVKIRVFNIISSTQLQGYFSGSYDAIVVEMRNPFSGIYENDTITVYGIVYGNQCGTNAFGAQICQPALIDAFYTK